MEHKLSIKSLFIHLKKAKKTNPEPKKAQSKQAAWDELSVGARYLYKRAMIPVLNGENVYSSNLDLSMITEDDIKEVIQFSENFKCPYNEQINKLKRIYREVKRTSPLATPVVYV